MQHLLRSQDLSKAQILQLFEKAKAYLPLVKERKKLNVAEGKILATLFYEPSTRTRFSFEAAMLRLGGSVLSNPQMETTSSAKKGETLYDTGRTVSQMADVIAMRHAQIGSVAELARGSDVPVLNAGDGPGDHPTQGLLDLFTLFMERGSLDGLTIAMVGDLKNSRVLHSQCELLKHFSGLSFILISFPDLAMPREIVETLKSRGFSIKETERFEEGFSADVLSMTRVQEERFANAEEYQKFKGVYVLKPEHLQSASKDLIILDPLPRIDQIQVEVDSDPRAKYFKQVQNGVAMRMALLATVLSL